MRAASQFCHPYCGPQQSRGLSLVRREAAARRQPSRSSSSGSGVATRHGFAHRPRAHLGSARPVVQNETDCASSFCCRAVRALRTLVQRPVSTQNLTPGGAGATSLAQPQRLSTGTEQAVRAASSVQSDRLCLSATAPSRSVQAQHLSVHTSRASPPRRSPSPSSLAPTARHAGRERRSLPRSSSAFASDFHRGQTQYDFLKVLIGLKPKKTVHAGPCMMRLDWRRTGRGTASRHQDRRRSSSRGAGAGWRRRGAWARHGWRPVWIARLPTCLQGLCAGGGMGSSGVRRHSSLAVHV